MYLQQNNQVKVFFFLTQIKLNSLFTAFFYYKITYCAKFFVIEVCFFNAYSICPFYHLNVSTLNAQPNYRFINKCPNNRKKYFHQSEDKDVNTHTQGCSNYSHSWLYSVFLCCCPYRINCACFSQICNPVKYSVNLL